jgi:Flp pilus assembly pilin Flp
MIRPVNFVKSLLADEDGNTATEYGIMLALIIIFAIFAVWETGEIQEAMWFRTADKVQSIVPP